MIRIELGEERDGPGASTGRRHGIWHWWVDGTALSGYSRQPLLDACRELKRTGADTSQAAGLFWPRQQQPSLSCRIEVGAELTVRETRTDGPKFVKYRSFEGVSHERRTQAGTIFVDPQSERAARIERIAGGIGT